MISSLESALHDALSLARLLCEGAARMKAAEARAEQAEQHFRVLSELHCRELAAHQADVRQLRRERDDEEAQAIEALRQRDRAIQERDAARGSLDSALADINRACALAMCRPGAGPVEIVETMTKREIRRGDELRAARAEAERLSAELRTLKSQGGGRS